VPPVASIGRGLASYLVTQDSATVYYSLEVLDVSSPITMVHIHLGHAGQNGDVVANLAQAVHPRVRAQM
jgi:CHRD domain